MPDSSRASVNLDVQVGRGREPAAPLPTDPFLIAVVGDLSGRARRTAADAAPLGQRRLTLVDRDELDDVLARIQPRLALDLEDGTRVDLAFRELEDFHPDRLFERAPFFRSLRETRLRLARPDSFRDTLDSILGGSAPQRPPSAADAADDVVADVLGGGGSLLDRVVGGQAAETGDPLRRYLKRVVAPHVVPGSDPQRDALLADVDAAIAAGLREVLRHPALRALEALWRGVDFLVRRLETGPSLKLMLLDATQDELAADLAGARDPSASDLATALRRIDGSFAAVVIDATIADDAAGIAFARGLAGLGARTGAAVLAGAAPGLVGFDTLRGLPDLEDMTPFQDDAWHALRRSPDAAWLGLVLPRVLLRVPYGERGEPCDRLDFEEVGDPPGHDEFLWGNGAFAAALLLGEAFTAAGWRMRPGSHVDVPGLPIYGWKGETGPEMLPCAECLMSDRLADALMEAGPMVLATIRHGDTARLVRFQSIASPLRALQGPWSRAG